MNHTDIKFSSLNPSQVHHYEDVLSDVTKEQIKTNVVVARHSLMLNMNCAGDSPLSDEYFHMRQIRYDAINLYCVNNKRFYMDTDISHRRKAVNIVNKMILDNHGWVFDEME
jgi:hypothetical protein